MELAHIFSYVVCLLNFLWFVKRQKLHDEIDTSAMYPLKDWV